MNSQFKNHYILDSSLKKELIFQFRYYGLSGQLIELNEKDILIDTDLDEDTFTYIVDRTIQAMEDMETIRAKATVDVDALFEQCKQMLRDIGIPIALDEQMHLEIRRIKNSDVQAYCSIMGGRYTIVVKACHTTGKHPDIQQLCCEIMHELVHTCKGCDNHGKLFMEYGRIIDEKLGCNILQLEDLLSYRHADQAVQIIGECSTCLSAIIYRTDKDIDKNIIMSDGFLKGMNICPYCKCEYEYKRVAR